VRVTGFSTQWVCGGLVLLLLAQIGLGGCVPTTPSPEMSPTSDIEAALSLAGIDSLVNDQVNVYGDISPEGLAGPNRSGWRSVAYQADGAYYAALMAIHTGDPHLADKALRCVEVGLAHQGDDRMFDHSVRDTLRFVILASAALSFLSQSQFGPPLAGRIDLALSRLVPTADLLLEATRDPERLQEARETANIVVGLAFVLTYLGDRFERDDLRSAGLALVHDVINNLQAEEGYYLEKNGWDTGYQMVGMRGLYFLYESVDLEEPVRADVLASLRAAYAWEASRIDATGRIDDAGNTRTANDESDSPEGKGINYGQAALTFAFLSSLGEGFEGAETYYELVREYCRRLPGQR